MLSKCLNTWLPNGKLDLNVRGWGVSGKTGTMATVPRMTADFIQVCSEITFNALFSVYWIKWCQESQGLFKNIFCLKLTRQNVSNPHRNTRIKQSSFGKKSCGICITFLVAPFRWNSEKHGPHMNEYNSTNCWIKVLWFGPWFAPFNSRGFRNVRQTFPCLGSPHNH